MPVTRAQKEQVVELMSEKLSHHPSVYITDYKGLNVAEVSQLRQMLREAGVEYRVVKNTLLQRAMETAGGFESSYDFLSGPTAVAICLDPSAAARAIKAFRKKSGQALPVLKAAIIDGDLYQGSQIDALASLKSKDELLGEVVTLILSPIQNVVSALGSSGSNLRAIIESLQNRNEA